MLEMLDKRISSFVRANFFLFFSALRVAETRVIKHFKHGMG
jgi:hypothetical protein